MNRIPFQVTSLKCGDRVIVSLDEIEDWIYLENGETVGGFSVKVIREMMKS